MSLNCDCTVGEEWKGKPGFTERIIVESAVDAEGNLESKWREESYYHCRNCGKLVFMRKLERSITKSN